MKPRTRPFSEKPQTSSERMPSSANRAAVDRESRRGASVSRISTMRRWSRPLRENRQALERVALHDLRVERREQSGGARHALDRLALGVEQRDADRIDAGGFAQRVEVALDAAVAAFAGQGLEIDGDLGGEHVETDLVCGRRCRRRPEWRGSRCRPALSPPSGGEMAIALSQSPAGFRSVWQPAATCNGTAAQFY